ncbi:MAG: NnrS family protein, partial [Campylobacter sp.]|nr:NnrS family protein [Campylobacter sp.]
MNNFFTHPMRIFFISACFCGICGGLVFYFSDNFLILHQMLFLNLLPACAYGGFLLTAIPDWANYHGSLKKIGFTLFGLVFLAFLSFP